MSATAEFIALVERVTGRQGRRQGREIVLLCPAHDDHHASSASARATTAGRSCSAGRGAVVAGDLRRGRLERRTAE